MILTEAKMMLDKLSRSLSPEEVAHRLDECDLDCEFCDDEEEREKDHRGQNDAG